MAAARFTWERIGEFLNRTEELAQLEGWWAGSERMPINLYGRRRAGKSWLFRRLAHGKPAVLLIAARSTQGAQLKAFAERLEPIVGVVPDIADLAGLFRVLFRAARKEKLLVVIDEFPWLLPTGKPETDAELSAIQAVFEEERDSSKLKLILCGSLVSQMESLQSESNPMHGRLIALHVKPLPYPEASLFLDHLPPLERFERFAITGGMPRYLHDLGTDPDLRTALSSALFSPSSALLDEARTVLMQELREPRTYFAILAALAHGDKELGEIANAIKVDSGPMSKYLATLQSMGIVRRRNPINAPDNSRNAHWHLADPFFRFWFRFVFPYQDDIENGLAGTDLFDAEVAPELNDHVAVEFEEWCRAWTRSNRGAKATKVGSWWGRAPRELRERAGRSSEEVDVVGMSRGRVTVIGEAKWQNKPLGPAILNDIEQYKIPALQAAGFKLADSVEVVLFAKAGYTKPLLAAADRDQNLTLVDVPAAL